MTCFKEYYNRTLLQESAGYGHINHPYDNEELTFVDLKEIIKKALKGQLQEQYEKNDGQNLLISYKNNHIIFARNKTQIKEQGEQALDIKGLLDFFKDNLDNVERAFVFASSDLQKAFSNINSDILNEYFQEGKKFLSVEIIFPETENVIPYQQSFIICQQMITYDENGNAINYDREEAIKFFKLIDKNVGSNFVLKTPEKAKIDISNSDTKIKEFIKELDKIKGPELKDDNTIKDYKDEGLDITLLQNLFGRLGIEVVKGISNLLVNNSDKAIQKIKSNLDKKITEVENGNNQEATDKLNMELQRLKDLGGFNNILGSEGIVFKYKGKMYKLTGSFAVVNQILGINKYDR